MIEISKDSKSQTLVITKTDNEGFHSQLHVTRQELIELIRNGIKVCFKNN